MEPFNFEYINQLQLGLSILLIIFIIFFLRRILRPLLGLDIASQSNKRLRQLELSRTGVQDKESEMQQQLDSLTEPIVKYLFPHLKLKNTWEKTRDLKLLGWDKHFTVERWNALNILLKIVGVGLFIPLYFLEPIIAFVWAFPFVLLMDILYHSQIAEKKDHLLMEFPDFIEVLEGYLSAGYDFVRATESAIPVTSHWQPILREFVAIAQYENLETGFKHIYDMVDIFEVREFLSVLQLGIEQGIDMAENIQRQSKRIEELQSLAFTKKIASREVMAVFVQGPLLLLVLTAFSLPTVNQMFSLGSM